MIRVQKDHISMILQNIMFVGEVFQIEVSDGLVHPLGSCQNVNLYPAVVIDDWGASFQEFLCVYSSKGSLQ